MSEKNFEEALISQIKVHHEFMEMMEQIRWKFSSAFGVTAILGVALILLRIDISTLTGGTLDQVFVYIFVWLVCISAVVTQVRIFSLFSSSWHKSHRLQQLLLDRFELGEDRTNFQSYWAIQDVEFPIKLQFMQLLLTVHGVTCTLFCFLGVAPIAIYLGRSLQSEVYVYALLVLLTAAFTYLAIRWTISVCEKTWTYRA